MSKVVKSVKKGLSSVARTVKGAVKGDTSDIFDIFSLGANKPTEAILSKTKEVLLPELPDVNIPPPGAAAPQQVQQTQAVVDVAATEQQRRVAGSAKGSRKLRVPLGGLR